MQKQCVDDLDNNGNGVNESNHNRKRRSDNADLPPAKRRKMDQVNSNDKQENDSETVANNSS